MKKSSGYIAGVIVLLALGAGVAWYVHGLRKQDAAVQREDEQSTMGVHAPSAVSHTGKDVMQATGVAASVIDDQTKAFADAVGSATAVLDPNLTNVTEELIAQVFKGLSDPTDIIPILDAYSTGNAAQRQIAKAFFEYMLKTYPEERLQACGHYMLGALEYVITDDGLQVDEDAFARAITHLEAVVALPSKRYWYSPALDLLAHKWMVVGGNDSQRRVAAFANARRYWMERYRYHESRGELGTCDMCLINMFDAMETDKQLRAHYQRYKNRRFSSPKYREAFFDNAKLYRADAAGNQ